VTKVDSFQTNASSLLNNYMDARSASSEKRQRIDLLDLKEQTEGEAHIFFKSRIVRARMFYAAPKPVNEMRLNHFLKVEPPTQRYFIEMEQRIDQFNQVVKTTNSPFFEAPSDEGEEIHLLTESLRKNAGANLIERSISALLALQTQQEPEEPEMVEEEFSDGRLNIFSRVSLPERVKNLVGSPNFDHFSAPLLNKSVLRDKIGLLERILGRSASQVNVITDEIMKDVLLATDYPPDVTNLMRSQEEVIASTHELCDYLGSLKDSGDNATV